METVAFIGRVVFGGFFLLTGVENLTWGHRAKIHKAAVRGVPAPRLATLASGVMLLTGAVSILTGYLPVVGVAVLVLFIIPGTLLVHNFWTIDDPELRAADRYHFQKNVALVGATLMLLAR